MDRIPVALSPFEVIRSLSELDQQAIIRPDNPPAGVAGFLFDIPEDEEIRLQAEITDNYVEANYAIQDHIAIKPVEYTLRGLVAEIAAYAPSSPRTATVENPLPVNPNIVPELTPGALQTQAQLEENRDEAAREATAENTLFDFYKARSAAPPDQPKQARAFLYFNSLMIARQLFTVETPWGFLYPVALLQVRANQGPETRFRSEFELTFKLIRTAAAVTITAGQLAGRALQQAADTTQNGTAGKTPVTSEERQSLLYRFLNPQQ
jgi:hypothetical protein